MNKKIVTIGPESTGKSVLSKQLCEVHSGKHVEEYARTFLYKHGVQYNYEDLYTIAQGQIAAEEKAVFSATGNQPIFLDTNLWVVKVWSEFVFNACDNRILKGIANREYDLYLLCRPDLPWVKDELREYPDQKNRDILFKHYYELLTSQATPFVIVEGDYDNRLRIAKQAVEKIIAPIR